MELFYTSYLRPSFTMKILTKEEEQEHYKYYILDHGLNARADLKSVTLKGGILGGTIGLAIGGLGIYGAGIRYPAFRQLTLPLRAFLITSAGTFSGMRVSLSAVAMETEFEQHEIRAVENLWAFHTGAVGVQYLAYPILSVDSSNP